MVVPLVIAAAAGTGTAAAGTAAAGTAVAGAGAAGAGAGAATQAMSLSRIASTVKTLKQGKAIAQMANVSFPGKGGVNASLDVEALSPGGAKLKAFKAAKDGGMTDGNLSDFGHNSSVSTGTPDAEPSAPSVSSDDDWLPDPMKLLA